MTAANDKPVPSSLTIRFLGRAWALTTGGREEEEFHTNMDFFRCKGADVRKAVRTQRNTQRHSAAVQQGRARGDGRLRKDLAETEN